MSSSRCAQGLLVLSVVWLSASHGHAALKHSTYGGGQQFWVTGDSFASRSTDGGGSPHLVEHGPAGTNGALSGTAYHFNTEPGMESPFGTNEDWWVQYEVPAADLPGSFNLSGTWYFWGRVTSPGSSTSESDWLIVNGDPGDLNTSNPTDAEWFAALQGDSNSERVFQNISANGGTLSNYNWGWASDDFPAGSVRSKTLAVVDGDVTWRLYEREAGPDNALLDVLVWSNSPNYVPTDADFTNAVPEPAAAVLAWLALMSALATTGRRVR